MFADPSALRPSRALARRGRPPPLWARVSHYLKMSVRGVWADALNCWCRQPVVGDAPVVVSITSHGIRIARVHRTLESIGRGRLKPKRMMLWLGIDEQGRPLPPALRRLQRRGLEVRYTEDRGPHTKYFSYVCSELAHPVAMATADDDIWYPDFWLERLWTAHERAPGLVHCHRARHVRLQGGRLRPYDDWPLMRDDQPGPAVFATGVGGVIYPPGLLDRLRDAGAGFESCCPKADDLWLHVTALRNGFVAKQLGRDAQEFNTLPATQSIGLQNQNVVMRRNDVQAAATYTHQDLAHLRAPAIAPRSS